jgi:Ca2+/H+ antiporter, TMEM165/GDT1 family
MNRFGNPRKRRIRFFLFALVAIPFFLLLPLAVKLLWNYTLPPITNAGEIDYWRALGLLVLSRLLFGWPRGGGGWRGKGGHWREKWAQMSDEDRVKFKEEWRRRCERREDIPPAGE